MDLSRPESPNLLLHRKIIESDKLNRLPIILITEKGYDSTPLGFECTEMEDYVCYPLFDESAFLLVVQNLLRRVESKT